MNIQWYPGHMTKTRRMIAEQIKNVDAVCEILDARIPVSSRNPDVDELTAGKPRMVVLNRVDQADPEGTKRWAEHFRAGEIRRGRPGTAGGQAPRLRGKGDDRPGGAGHDPGYSQCGQVHLHQ